MLYYDNSTALSLHSHQYLRDKLDSCLHNKPWYLFSITYLLHVLFSRKMQARSLKAIGFIRVDFTDFLLLTSCHNKGHCWTNNCEGKVGKLLSHSSAFSWDN